MVNRYILLDNWQPYQSESDLEKSVGEYIKKDLYDLGVDLSKISFTFEIFGFDAKYFKFVPKNEYTKVLLKNKSLEQIIRIIKLERLLS